MTDSTDGGYGELHARANTAIAVDLQQFRKSISTLFMKCKSYKASLRDDAALDSYVPIFIRYVGELLRPTREEEYKESLLDALVEKYSDLDGDSLRAEVQEVIDAATLMSDLDERDLKGDHRDELHQRIEDFCDAFSGAHNRLAAKFKDTTTKDSEGFIDRWLTGESVIQTVRTQGYL